MLLTLSCLQNNHYFLRDFKNINKKKIQFASHKKKFFFFFYREHLQIILSFMRVI